MLTLCVQLLALRGKPRTPLTTAIRTVAAGLASVVVLFPIIGVVASLSKLSTSGHGSYVLAEAVSYGVVVAFGTITVWTLIRTTARITMGSLEFVCGTTYLIVFVGLWGYALPEYLNARDEITAVGTRTGSLPYVIGCYIFLGFLMWRVFARRDSTATGGEFRSDDGRDPSAKVAA
jgi:hypothetical protein